MGSSSDVVDSGRFTRQNSSKFSQTCTLLSQYLKEKGRFGDIGLGFNRNFEPNGAPTKTMNLLPMIEKRSPTEELPALSPENICATGEPEKAQMTIFYAGQVIVLNDFPADKAKEIMNLANSGSPLNAKAFTAAAPTTIVESASKNVTSSPTSIVPNFGNIFVQDLPIARRASLTRFLEKRKDRITSKAPYQTINHRGVAAASKPHGSKAWLGLASQGPLQMGPHV